MENPSKSKTGQDSVLKREDNNNKESNHKQKAELLDVFRHYDLDGNGVISLNEAQFALQTELRLTADTSLRLLNQFVKLNYEQFVDFYQDMQTKKIEIYDMFGRYDTDHDGMISAEEAHSVLSVELGYSEEKSKAMVDKYDVNKDGQVSYSEFAEFYIAVEERKAQVLTTFRRFDPEGSGFIALEQASQALQKLLGFSQTKADAALDTFDANHDGRIDYVEFLTFYTAIEEERQKILEEFDQYDTNGDRRISLDEFKNMLSKKGYTHKEILTLMAGYDTGHKGYLTFTEFRKYLNFK